MNRKMVVAMWRCGDPGTEDFSCPSRYTKIHIQQECAHTGVAASASEGEGIYIYIYTRFLLGSFQEFGGQKKQEYF
jgi:hypothetical protein